MGIHLIGMYPIGVYLTDVHLVKRASHRRASLIGVHLL
jgi:hypothetical protein